jgi:CheY-like chemotaxis protein
MGGDLLCSSEAGLGSVFWLTTPLPACEAPAHLPTQAESSIAQAMDTQPNPSALLDFEGIDEADLTVPAPAMEPEPIAGHVLLVEDNPVNALVAEASMAQMGLTITLVTDGQQALDLLIPGPHPYDIVLMDCQMPVLDGLEATRRLRIHEHDTGSPNVPVVALTANALPQDRQRCTAAGMDDHLAKPFRHGELAAVLRRHLVHKSVTA